jgi:hypothetical protein
MPAAAITLTQSRSMDERRPSASRIGGFMSNRNRKHDEPELINGHFGANDDAIAARRFEQWLVEKTGVAPAT